MCDPLLRHNPELDERPGQLPVDRIDQQLQRRNIGS